MNPVWGGDRRAPAQRLVGLLVCALHGLAITALASARAPEAGVAASALLWVGLAPSTAPAPQPLRREHAAPRPTAPRPATPALNPPPLVAPAPAASAVLASAAAAVTEPLPAEAAPAAMPPPAAFEAPRFAVGARDTPAPSYPALARRLGEQGRVVVRVWVDAEGRPARIALDLSSGSPRLDAAALAAVETWRFRPAQRGDRPEAAEVLVPFVFALDAPLALG